MHAMTARRGSPCTIPVVAVVVLLVSACTTEVPQPTITSVDPGRGWNGGVTSITIEGTGFYPRVRFDAGASRDGSSDERFSAWLEPSGGEGPAAVLQRVQATDPTHIVADVAAGSPVGTYDVVIETPAGRRARLPEAFVVSDTRAAALELDIGRSDWLIDAIVTVDLSLVDADGELLGEDDPFEFPVLASVRSQATGDALVPIEWRNTGLSDVEIGADGQSLSGVLPSDRQTQIKFQVSEPMRVTFQATVPDASAGVLGATLSLEFIVGPVGTIEVLLPGHPAPFTARAGEPFDVTLRPLDVDGNLVDDQTSVNLENRCGGWAADADLTGETTVEVVLVDATRKNQGCNLGDGVTVDPLDYTDSIQVSFPSGSSASAGFEVEAGPVRQLELQVLASAPFIAGESVAVLVSPRDAWFNEAEWTTDELELTSSTGGLQVTECGETFESDDLKCDVAFTVASDQVSLRANDPVSDVSGSSGPFAVSPAALSTLTIEVPDEVVAGEPYDVVVRGEDRFGNLTAPATLPTLVDVEGDAVCEPPGAPVDAALRYSCVSRVAREGVVLVATLASPAVEASSAAFTVVNGELANVGISAVSSVTAGVSFPVTVTATDGYGNPYLEQRYTSLRLRDVSGTVDPSTVLLQADGTGSVEASLTKAGLTRIEALAGGSVVGTSASITVLPAETDALRVTVLSPWVWVDEPADVRVETVDAWGNRTDDDVNATASSDSGVAAPVPVPVVNGIGLSQLVWPAVAPAADRNDQVVAVANDGSEATGRSVSLPVVDRCGFNGPRIRLGFDSGHPEAVACFDPGYQSALIRGDFAGSRPAAGLIGYYLSADGVGTERATQAEVLLEIPKVGIWPLHGLVIQADGCAAEADTHAYVGLADGRPVGPLRLVSDLEAFDSLEVTDVHLDGVTDCSRDLVQSADVYLRTERGELLDVEASGQGLTTGVIAGAADFGLFVDRSTFSVGGLQIHAWVPSDAARGVVDIAVNQDSVPPQVWSMSPAGLTSDNVPEIRLQFSEPIRQQSVKPANFDVTGLGLYEVEITDVVQLPDNTLVLILDRAADGSLGKWQVLALGEGVRDVAGNRLDGGWSGTQSDFVGIFGEVADAAQSVSCGPVRPQGGFFRPDGDDGAGIESDFAEIDVSTSDAPAWWRLSVVREATEALVRRDYLTPSSATETLTWDGRDVKHRIVPNGTYIIDVETVDANSNVGTGCSVTVVVDNRLGTLP